MVLEQQSFGFQVLEETLITMEKPVLVNNHISAMLMQESPKYEKNLNVLSSIITVSPILGILGTVLGLMDVFNVIWGV